MEVWVRRAPRKGAVVATHQRVSIGNDEYVSHVIAAKMLGTSRQNVRKLAKVGKVGVYMTPGGLPRVRLADVERLVKEAITPATIGA